MSAGLKPDRQIRVDSEVKAAIHRLKVALELVTGRFVSENAALRHALNLDKEKVDSDTEEEGE